MSCEFLVVYVLALCSIDVDFWFFRAVHRQDYSLSGTSILLMVIGRITRTLGR